MGVPTCCEHVTFFLNPAMRQHEERFLTLRSQLEGQLGFREAGLIPGIGECVGRIPARDYAGCGPTGLAVGRRLVGGPALPLEPRGTALTRFDIGESEPACYAVANDQIIPDNFDGAGEKALKLNGVVADELSLLAHFLFLNSRSK